jgi:hypothetical protein
MCVCLCVCFFLPFFVSILMFFFSEEDAWARYTQLLVKYFCAEGVVCGHAVSVISADQDPRFIIQVILTSL